MLAFERRNEIKKILRDEISISVEALSKKFYVSDSTIRRDLDKISNDGNIKRTYGGAVLLDNRTSELPMYLREKENINAKLIIAQSAVRLIKNGATIILDTSSTVITLVPLLSAFEGLTVITNGIKTAYLLNSYGKITTHCTGGRLRERNMSLVGMTTCKRLSEINADIAFISCKGLSLEKGVTEASEEEAEVKKAMISASTKTILLCDSTKIDKVLMNKICNLNKLDMILSDKPLSKKYQDALKFQN